MKISGVKISGVLVAGLVAYIIGALIYGVFFAKYWQGLTGINPESAKGQEWRMALSWIMPLVLSFAIAKRSNSLNIQALIPSIKSGLAIGLILVFGCELYDFVYSINPVQLFVLDSAHLLLISGAIGAVHSLMKTTSN